MFVVYHLFLWMSNIYRKKKHHYKVFDAKRTHLRLNTEKNKVNISYIDKHTFEIIKIHAKKYQR